MWKASHLVLPGWLLQEICSTQKTTAIRGIKKQDIATIALILDLIRQKILLSQQGPFVFTTSEISKNVFSSISDDQIKNTMERFLGCRFEISSNENSTQILPFSQEELWSKDNGIEKFQFVVSPIIRCLTLGYFNTHYLKLNSVTLRFESMLTLPPAVFSKSLWFDLGSKGRRVYAQHHTNKEGFGRATLPFMISYFSKLEDHAEAVNQQGLKEQVLKAEFSGSRDSVIWAPPPSLQTKYEQHCARYFISEVLRFEVQQVFPKASIDPSLASLWARAQKNEIKSLFENYPLKNGELVSLFLLYIEWVIHKDTLPKVIQNNQDIMAHLRSQNERQSAYEKFCCEKNLKEMILKSREPTSKPNQAPRSEPSVNLAPIKTFVQSAPSKTGITPQQGAHHQNNLRKIKNLRSFSKEKYQRLSKHYLESLDPNSQDLIQKIKTQMSPNLFEEHFQSRLAGYLQSLNSGVVEQFFS